MDAHSAANTCSCGEHSSMMAVFGLIEGGRVVDAAAGIVTALGSCSCDEAREFLRDAASPSGCSTQEFAGGGEAVALPVNGGLRVGRTGAVGRSFGGVRWHRWFGG